MGFEDNGGTKSLLFAAQNFWIVAKVNRVKVEEMVKWKDTQEKLVRRQLLQLPQSTAQQMLVVIS